MSLCVIPSFVLSYMAKKKTTQESDLKVGGFYDLKVEKLKCKNSEQKDCRKTILENNITIIRGKAGTGKSFISLATALELLRDKQTPYEKLVLMVAPVQTDIEIGYIKGDMMAKLSPFAYSYLYNLADMIQGGIKKVEELVNEGYIEIMCVAFARGINLKNCVCICGECQQYSKESFLTLISRPTETAKMIFEGDIYQTDNKNIRKGKEESGLQHAIECLGGLSGVGFVDFNNAEVVRNPLITDILKRWDPEKYDVN